jgi:glutamine amidotransferase
MREIKVVIIDYSIGNVKSMYNAFYSLGISPDITSNKQKILDADAVVLPGVGAFRKGMENLNNSDLSNVIKDYVKKGNPFLGVCLGMQMLLEESEEFGLSEGLGLIKGKVIKLPVNSNSKEMLPHVSWNELKESKVGRWENTILANVPQNTNVYFVHSYIAVPLYESDVLSTTNYAGVDFCSTIQHENIYGTQFHPEKSSSMGLKILKNFVNLKNRK